MEGYSVCVCVLQEQMENLEMGRIPGSIRVTLEDDLVDTCRPGDDVVIW